MKPSGQVQYQCKDNCFPPYFSFNRGSVIAFYRQPKSRGAEGMAGGAPDVFQTTKDKIEVVK